MTSIEAYRAVLRSLAATDWESYLMAHSRLPGPRANLELAAAAADLGAMAQFRRWASLGPDVAPENTPECFLAFCGVLGLNTWLPRRREEAFPYPPAVTADLASDASPLQMLRGLAADPRWRIREGVAMALQRWGDAHMDGLLAEMATWAAGNPWEQRAAAAALCEPRLLKDEAHAAAVLRILDEITASLERNADRRGEAFKTLRQGLAYCWSVAVAALPHVGKPLMEKWLASPDFDTRWLIRENLKKNRLAKMDATWVDVLSRRNVGPSEH